VPYCISWGDGVPYNIFPVASGRSPPPSAPSSPAAWVSNWWTSRRACHFSVVLFNAVTGGGSIDAADTVTDRTGMAFAQVDIGSQPATRFSTATAADSASNSTATRSRLPAIAGNGVIAGSVPRWGQGLAPGSYISDLRHISGRDAIVLNSRALHAFAGHRQRQLRRRRSQLAGPHFLRQSGPGETCKSHGVQGNRRHRPDLAMIAPGTPMGFAKVSLPGLTKEMWPAS